MYLYPILSTLGALLVLTGEVIKSDKIAPRATDWSKLMILTGGVMVIIVAFLSAIDAGEQQGRMETLAGATKALVTGGNSMVWIRPIEDPAKPGSFSADLVHGGDVVPSFDIDIEIVETSLCDGLENWAMGQALASGVGNPRIQFIPAFGPQTVKSLTGHLEPSCDEAYYLVFIQTRNRATIEQILIKKDKGKWRKALRVQELHVDKTLVDEIDTGFIAAGERVSWPDLNVVRKVLSSRFGN